MVRSHHLTTQLGSLLLLGALLGCGTDTPPGWRGGLEQARTAKDEAFRRSDSPLSPEDRTSFAGLPYWPVDSSWRFTVPPDRSGAGQQVELLDTAGQSRNYRVHSLVRLRVDGTLVELTVYEAGPGEPLFLPFTDATNGEASYAAGRYLPVNEGRDGLLVIDFNRAYNPYCAYDERWVCPVVPAQNRVPMAVTAGEKTWPGGSS